MLKKKSTIINTNLSLKQINKVYSERVSSRIIESYQIFHIYGEDIRVKKAFSISDAGFS
jgi:DNA replication protein DnaC